MTVCLGVTPRWSGVFFFFEGARGYPHKTSIAGKRAGARGFSTLRSRLLLLRTASFFYIGGVCVSNMYIVHTIQVMRIIASSFLLLTRSLLFKSPHHRHNTSLHPPRPLTAQAPTSNTKEQRPYLAFSASASGAQSVLADNPLVPVWC